MHFYALMRIHFNYVSGASTQKWLSRLHKHHNEFFWIFFSSLFTQKCPNIMLIKFCCYQCSYCKVCFFFPKEDKNDVRFRFIFQRWSPEKLNGKFMETALCDEVLCAFFELQISLTLINLIKKFEEISDLMIPQYYWINIAIIILIFTYYLIVLIINYWNKLK